MGVGESREDRGLLGRRVVQGRCIVGNFKASSYRR